MPKKIVFYIDDDLSEPGLNRLFNQLCRTAGLDRDELVVRDAREWGLGPIAELRPNVIVPMGPLAIQELTGAKQIDRFRGTVLYATQGCPGVKILPTYNLSYIFQAWKFFHVVVADMEKAWRESEFPQVRLPRRELWIAPSLGDLDHFRREYIDKSDLLSVDIETGWGQITCIGFAPDAHRAIVVPFWDLRRPSRSYWPTLDDEAKALGWCASVLEGPTPKLFQNGPYDITWLWDRYKIAVRNYRHDTRLMHHALYPEMPKSLEFMGACYATQGPWKLLRGGKDDKRDA